VTDLYINKAAFLIASFLYFQVVSASELPSFNVDDEKEQVSNTYALCDEDFYSNSKFDYKSHYVTSLRFTLPENRCLPIISHLFDRKNFISSD